MDSYYGVTRSEDYLKHYGITGMKWGVRKAIFNNNDKALERHYRKASKKLAKLEDIGNNPAKYAAKSTAYGAAAIGTGTIAVNPKNVVSAFPRKAPKGNTYAETLRKNFIREKSRKGFSKNVRLISGLATLGLAAKSGQNAYRAANAKKYRRKAAEFRSAIKESFKGTKYEGLNGVPLPSKRQIRRKSK